MGTKKMVMKKKMEMKILKRKRKIFELIMFFLYDNTPLFLYIFSFFLFLREHLFLAGKAILITSILYFGFALLCVYLSRKSVSIFLLTPSIAFLLLLFIVHLFLINFNLRFYIFV